MRRGCAAALVCAGVLALGTAAAAEAIPNCVSPHTIETGPDRHAWLDERDRNGVAALLRARYPLLGRDGFAPAAILLWQRGGREWLYVAVQTDPAQPGGRCYAATVHAPTIDATPALLRKYFGADAVVRPA